MTIARLLAGGILTVALTGTAMAGPMGPGANRDAPVTRAELNARLDQRFKAMDTNGNGQIEAAEMQAAREARKAKWQERREARAADGAAKPAGERKRPGQWAGKRGGDRPQMDANGDGVITRDEFGARALARFDAADTNRDGTVTKEERAAHWEARKAARGK
ncbi:EF-hand domain-containing protein [Erythrobacter sp. WG]|uniref:EF-hand domain-containing protein n=1 Tax=Erythrobacter sp. WG TaxID=2985510 RepID=UPI002271FBCB|nr:hypothetical protein [Erythrobacter sp. WG]MCX9148480.1 hypothetical protein [Erythrobacter sp. WG]